MLVQGQNIYTLTTDQILSDIEKCSRSSKIIDLLAKAERMQMFLDMHTPHTLPDKELYVHRLYCAVGEGYLTQNRWSHRLSERGNRRRVAFLMGLPAGRSTLHDSVIANFPTKCTDIKKATEKVMENLDMCENSTMKCWLMYELARLLCTQKNFGLAKLYGKQLQRVAEELGNTTWWLNGCLVLMSGEMQQGHVNEVRGLVEEALAWIGKLQDPEPIEAFFRKCIDVVSETKVADDRKAIVERENQILSVICDKRTRGDMQRLFRRIAAVPAGRRFSVLPSKPRPGPTTAERRRYRQRGLTIVPGKEKALMRPPESQVPGFQTFDT